MGTFIDISGLLSDLGINTETITSGANKSMGSNTEPMTDEQRAIFQSLTDEAYEQFVSIVAEGRGMSNEQVRELADGRIYSAQQAVDNGLVDEIGTFEEAVSLRHGRCVCRIFPVQVLCKSFRPAGYHSRSEGFFVCHRRRGHRSADRTQRQFQAELHEQCVEITIDSGDFL